MKAKDPTPASWLFHILKWFCPNHLYEEIEGDLIQKFNRDVQRFNEKKAKRRLMWNALWFVRPGIILRNKLSMNLSEIKMFRNYFKITFRNIARQKVYSAITILGLVVGITFSMLIGVFVWSEHQVNQDLNDVDRLYLLDSEYKNMEGGLPPFFVPALLGERAANEYPGLFENFYRFRDRSVTISKGDKHFRIQSMIGDSTLIRMFGFQVLHGNADHALSQSNAIVITEQTARKFFNRIDVAGELLTISTENMGMQEYQITAVIADLQKKNSVSDFMNMDAQVFLSHANRDFNLGGIDWNASIITYIKLTPTASPKEASIALNKILEDEAPASIQKDRTIKLDPLSNYYLVTNHGAVQRLIVSLTVIAIFILLLAITNFINITVARSFSRLKEVGVRKVIGGIRKQIIFQFLSEAILFSILAGFLSLLMYELLHGYFGNVLNTPLPSITQINLRLWIQFVGGTVLIGALAGSYPALYLSTVTIIQSLKGKLKSVKGTIRFSRALIAVQFLIAIFIFTVSLIITQQISYFLEADPGYDKSHVMIVSSVPRIWNEEGFSKMEAAKNEFLSMPKIQSVSLSWGAPNFNFSPFSAKINKLGHPLEDGILASLAATDEDYANVYGLEVSIGKYLFDSGEAPTSNQMVVNESAQKALNIQVGDKIKIEFFGQEFSIAGIVKDFNFESFHKPVAPVVFIHTNDFQAFRYFSFKLAPGNISQSMQQVEEQWKKIFPDDPFVYSFTDERFVIAYKTELQLKKASVIGSILILIIVLTGVLGLVSLSVAKRNKEIGIRKVLGATRSNILVLMSSEYAWIMGVTFLVGIPLSFRFAKQWLSNFAYHIDLEWWMFALPVLLLFVITILVVVAQSLKTSLSNPVTALRYE